MFPPPAQVYFSLKKDMSWTGLSEFADDTITDYSRPSPSIKSNTSDLQNDNSSVSKYGESSSSIMSKPMIKFVKAADSPTVIKTNKVETARKSSVKYAEMYRNTSKSPKVRDSEQKTHEFIHVYLVFASVYVWIGYALTINPTVYVSHIRQFWSTARIETTNEETKILVTVDGKPRTISESSFRRHLKLNDAEGISSLLDTELFENPSLMGYNILPNQRFTFQKGQFSHQWKFLIHTIMQCLSPKSTGFNEFSSNIATVVGEGSAIPTEPHHTPSPQEQQSPHYASSSPSNLTATTEPIHTETPTETPTLRQYSRRATRIAQSKALYLAADEPASLLRDDSQGEAFPTITSFEAGQDGKNINKTSALPHESTPRVTSLDADEGTQDLEISGLKARIKLLEDKDRGNAEPFRDDTPIKERSMEIGDEVEVERSTELGSNDTEEMVNVLSSMKAANILTSGVAAVSVSPVAGVSIVGVPTVCGLFPTVSAIFTTASEVTPYSRRPRGISAKDKARIHAEEELKMLIDGMDRSNEVIARNLQEYEQSEAELTIGENIELINELMKYQDHHAKILKYQAQQSKPLSKKEQREFYMSVLRSHAGWKTKHFRGMTLEEIKEKFIPVWKQLEDFVPMSSTKEGKRMKRKGLKLDEGSSKRMKTSEDVSEEDLKGMMQLVHVEEVYVEDLQVKEGKRDYWKIIRLVGHTAVCQFFIDMLKQLDREDLHQLWALVKETLSIRQALRDKEKELWVELKRIFEPDFEDQLWTYNQNLMHDPLDWKLYDTCGVHHVFTKD
uniref:Synaptobrevin, longin-like domain protein n=1 Tax=Tanacetum cinerariifolium TaxID=118510 RepID=A0A6L2NHN8_TANCI|nr:hypothetical protein [Tanacetum cinerariifolium]